MLQSIANLPHRAGRLCRLIRRASSSLCRQQFLEQVTYDLDFSCVCFALSSSSMRHSIMTPAYCSQCKGPLTTPNMLDQHNAFCAKCDRLVVTSCFQVPGWVIGVILLLACMISLQY